MTKLKKPGWMWVYDPHSGGAKIPPKKHYEVNSRIITYAKTIAPNITIDVKFRAQFCYVGTKENDIVMPVCRIRFLGNLEILSFALYVYSSDRYQPCLLLDGNATGNLESILEACKIYLN